MSKVKIKGVAVKEGTSRNKRKYLASELEKFAPTLINKPILKDHQGITDNVIGKVTNAYYKPDTTEVMYEGWIKEDGTKILDKVKDGRINEVSIGAMAGKVVKEKKDDEVLIPTQMEAMELSTTPVPGNKGTSLTFGMENYTKEDIKKMIDEYNKSNVEEKSNSYSESVDTTDNNNINERRITMEAEKQTETNNEAAKNQVSEEVKQVKEQLEKLQTEKAELEKARVSDAITRYNEKCKAKGLEAKNMEGKSLEMINFAIEMVDDAPEPKSEEESEDKKEEEAEEPKEEEKPKAEPQSKEGEVEDSEEENESWKGYVLTTEDVSSGYAFFKEY